MGEGPRSSQATLAWETERGRNQKEEGTCVGLHVGGLGGLTEGLCVGLCGLHLWLLRKHVLPGH